MTDTQAQEAARLAEWHRDQALQWRRAAAFEAADYPEPTRSMLTRKAVMHVDAADLIERQAARIAELERELARMREPLSDEQIRDIGALQDPRVVVHREVLAFARAIEAAHGITKPGEQQ